ncbi:MAG: hypothetical protein ACR2LX_14800 [Jatrophihabitans sp.]
MHGTQHWLRRAAGTLTAAALVSAGALALSTTADAVTPAQTIAVATPTKITTGDPATSFSGTAMNNSTQAINNARYDISLTGDPGLSASDITLEYALPDAMGNPTGTFAPVPLTGSTTATGGAITGSFGPAAGFTFPANTTLTSNFRISVRGGAPTGTLTSTVTLDQVVGSGTVALASDTDTVRVESQYVAVTPTRIVDTRVANPLNPGPLVGNNTSYVLDLTKTDVPLNEAAYVFNVTGVQPSRTGNLRISAACGNPSPPTTSIVNYQPQKDVANDLVVSNLGSAGQLCNKFTVYSDTASANVVIDLQGYFSSTTGFAGVSPARIVDTRTGTGGDAGAIPANTSKTFQVTGAGNIPSGTTSVAINVTASQPSGVGNLRVYPADNPVPTSSNVNYVPGVDKAAFVITKLSSDGKVTLYSDHSSTNVAIDVFGYLPVSSQAITQPPVRVYDSRNTGGPIVAGTPRVVPVTTGTTSGVPTDAKAVVVSLTAIHVTGGKGVGNLRAYPGPIKPVVSNINYIGPNTDVANLAIVPLGDGGAITLATEGSSMNAAVDVVGYIPADVQAPAGSQVRNAQ